MANKQINLFSGLTNVGTTVETIIGTSLPYTYDEPNPFVGLEHAAQGPGQGVSITGIANLVPSAGSTTATLRVRQGGLTGPIVGGAGATIVSGVTAAVAVDLPYEFEDLSRFTAQSGGGVYVLTVQMAGASGTTAVQPVTMDVQGA